MIVTCQVLSGNWKPLNVYNNGVKLSPVIIREGTLGMEVVYKVVSGGKSLISSSTAPGYVALTDPNRPITVAISFYGSTEAGSIAQTCQRHQRHANHFVTDLAQIFQITRLRGLNQQSPVINHEPTSQFVIDTSQGYCWLQCLKNIPKVAVATHKDHILAVKQGCNPVRLDLRPLISSNDFIKCISSLNAQKFFQDNYNVSIMNGIGHIEYAPDRSTANGLDLLHFAKEVGMIQVDNLIAFIRGITSIIVKQYGNQLIVTRRKKIFVLQLKNLTYSKIEKFITDIRAKKAFKQRFILSNDGQNTHLIEKGLLGTTKQIKRQLSRQSSKRQSSTIDQIEISSSEQQTSKQEEKIQDAAMSRAQVQTLLLIAGIQPNPGPIEVVNDQEDEPPDLR